MKKAAWGTPPFLVFAALIFGQGFPFGPGLKVINSTPVSNITLVQHTTVKGTNTKKYGSAVGAGNTLFIAVNNNFQASTVTSCGDDINGTWTHAANAPVTSDTNNTLDVWYFIGTAAGTPTVTCPMTAGTNNTMGLSEWHGIVAFDESAKSKNIDSVGAVTTDQANELLLLANAGVGGDGTCSTGFMLLDAFNDTTNANVQYVTAGAAGSYSATSCPSTVNFFTTRWLGAFK